MKSRMIEALKASANGEIKKHLVNIDVYLHNPVGIGEHSNIMDAVTPVSYTHLRAHETV